MILLLNGLLMANLTTVILSYNLRRDHTVIAHVELNLVVHVAIQLDLAIHQLRVQDIIVLILHRLTLKVLPSRNLSVTKHLHLLLKVLGLCLELRLLLCLLLLLLDLLW